MKIDKESLDLIKKAGRYAMTIGEKWSLREMLEKETDYPIVKQFGLISLLNSYLDSETVSLRCLVESNSAEQARAKTVASLIESLKSSKFGIHCQGVANRLRDIAKFYNLKGSEEYINDPVQFSELVKVAYEAPDRLNVELFSKGNPGGGIKLNPDVFAFRNIDHLLEAAQAHPEDGITVSAICDPKHGSSTFFAFVMRHGGNLLLMSDRDDTDNPLFAEHTRRPERDMSRRMEKGNFPYQLVANAVDSGAWTGYVIDEKIAQGISEGPIKIGKVAELPVDQALWAYLAVETILDKYVVRGEYPESITFTHRRLEGRLMLGNGEEIPKLTIEDIKHKPEHKEKLRDDMRNAWMEDRYSHLVNPDILEARKLAVIESDLHSRSFGSGIIKIEENGNLSNVDIRDESTKRVLETGGVSWSCIPANIYDQRTHNCEELALKKDRSEDCLTTLPNGAKVSWLGKTTKGELILADDDMLAVLPESRAGSPEKLESDRRWAARMNYARVLSRIARDEYDERKGEVLERLCEIAEENRSAIIDRFMTGEVLLPYRPFQSFTEKMKPVEIHNHLHITECFGWSLREANVLADLWPGIKRRYVPYDYTCPITKKHAVVALEASPKNGKALANLLNVKISDLPDIMQVWETFEPYIGNSILQRVDPVADLNSPWKDFKFSIFVPISRKCYQENQALRKVRLNNKTREKLGLPTVELEE